MLARTPLAGTAIAAILGSHVSSAAALSAGAAPSSPVVPLAPAPIGAPTVEAPPTTPTLRLKVATEAALPEPAIGMRGADFDGDGRNDLAIATAAGDVHVALNPGSDLSSWPWELVGSVPLELANEVYSGLAVADLDGDALSDLVVFGDAEAPGACAAVALMSLGDGNFATGATLAIVPPAPDDVVFGCTDIAIGDYDGDGALDVAVAFAYQPIDWFNGLLGAVNVFRGAGGEFEAPASYTLAPDVEPYVSFAMASGDFDGDGQADLGFGSAVRYLSGPVAWRVETLRGDGSGGFSPGALLPFDCTWCELELAGAADFDADGRDDLVLAPTNPESYPSDYPVLLFAGAGDSGFGGPEELVIQTGAIGVETQDVTADGTPDLLLTGDVDHVTLLEGLGDGSFAVPQRFVSGRAIAGNTLVDLDGDGARELVLLSNSPEPVFEIARGAAADAFELPRVSPVPVGYPEFIAPPADFDGDGDADILAIGYDGLDLLLGTGDGRFVLGARTPVAVAPWPLPIADLDGDGRLDLVQAAGDGFAVSIGLADGTFAPTPPAGERSISRAALGDIDGDGNPDLVAKEWPRETVDIYLGDGALGFRRAGSLPVNVYVSELVLADLNSDGHLDLLAGASGVPSGPDGEPLAPLLSPTWLGDGCGGFNPGAALDVSGYTFRVADLDADGALDVLGTNALAFGDGAGNFGPAEPLPSAGSWQIELADLDGDGFSDLLFEQSGLRIARGGPDGRFSPARLLTGASGWRSFAVAQLAGSPAPDLVALHTFTREDTSQTELIVAETVVVENITKPACGRRH